MIVKLMPPQTLEKLVAEETRALKLSELAWSIQLSMEVSVGRLKHRMQKFNNGLGKWVTLKFSMP